MKNNEDKIADLKAQLEKSSERLRVCSRRFAEMGNESFSAVVLEWYQETRDALLTTPPAKA